MNENEVIKKHIEDCEHRIGNILGFMQSNSDADTFSCEENIAVLKTAIIALEEIQQYRAIGTVKGYERAIESSIENYNLYREYKAKVQEYQAIGTVEELKKAKMQYDDIHSVAEKTALIGLSDYGTAKEVLITEMKRSLDCSLKEYQAIGTVGEFKALKEKNEPKKPTIERVNYSHNQYADNYKCPVCGQRMISKDEISWYSGRRSKYCDNCGQKLDWQ